MRICGFRGGIRTPCPVLIPLLTQAELDDLPQAVFADVMRYNAAAHMNSKVEWDAWMLMDMKTQAFFVKYLGASEHTHVRN